MEIFAFVNTLLLICGAVHVFMFKQEFNAFLDTMLQLRVGAINRLIELEITNAASIQRLADHLGLYDDVPAGGGSGVSPFDLRVDEGSAEGIAGLCEGRERSAGGSW